MPEALSDFNVFHRYAANYPWRSHAEWFLLQMLRWGHIRTPIDIHEIANKVYRPDLYKEAAVELGLYSPETDRKSEGLNDRERKESGIPLGADLFFDGKHYFPDRPVEYLADFEIPHSKNFIELLIEPTHSDNLKTNDSISPVGSAGRKD